MQMIKTVLSGKKAINDNTSVQSGNLIITTNGFIF